MRQRFITYVLVALVLFGCGGSGDSVGSGANPKITTTLIDLPATLNNFVMIRDMVALPDGSLLVTGFYDNSLKERLGVVFKLLPDTTLDTGFGDAGKTYFQVDTITSSLNLAVAGDGSIFVSGTTTPALSGSSRPKAFIARLTATGQIDTSFGTAGSASYQFSGDYATWGYAMGLLNNGKIIIGCKLDGYGHPSRFGLLGFDSDGLLDTTFGVNGEYISDAFGPFYWSDIYHNIIIQENDTIVAGIHALDFDTLSLVSHLEGYNADGSVNTTFGNNGYVDLIEKQRFQEILQKQNGDIITVGTNNGYTVSTDPELLVLAYDSSGSTLSSFGTVGQSYIDVDNNMLTEAFDIAEGVNGAVFVALYSEFVPLDDGSPFPVGGLQLAQIDNDGLINRSLGNNGVWVYDDPGYVAPISMAVLPDNTVYIGGTRGDVHAFEESFLLKVTVD